MSPKKSLITHAERIHPDSLANRIAALPVGETESRAIRLDGKKATLKVVNEKLNDLRNTVNKTAHRAKARSGNGYTVSAGSFMTADGDVVIVVAVTCTEEL